MIHHVITRILPLALIIIIAGAALFALAPSVVIAQFYSWTDDKGVTHFTNDLNMIPERYRPQMRIPPATKGTAPAVTPPAAPRPAETPREADLHRPIRETDLRELIRRTEAILQERERRHKATAHLKMPPEPPVEQATLWEVARWCQIRFWNLQLLEPFLQCYAEKLSEKRFTRYPLCFEGMTRVTSPWDGDVQHSYNRVWHVVSSELRGRTVSVSVIDSSERYNLAGAVCSDSHRSSIIVFLKRLEARQSEPDPEAALASIIAHEFAHIVLHQDDKVKGTFPRDWRTGEYEADELGVYYFERAGYDCRRWIDSDFLPARAVYDSLENVRQALKVACALAKAGTRPPRRAGIHSKLQSDSEPTRSSR